MSYLSQCGRLGFLMYRVELKDDWLKEGKGEIWDVPNVPCGVERILLLAPTFPCILFLMYRVELKDFSDRNTLLSTPGS